MLATFDGLRDVTLLSTVIRMLLAFLCGGLIGMEREFKKRPAGFRTHILICTGAAVTTLTSQFLYLNMHYFTDIGRFGAQVVAGIGFIGAGTIIVTKHRSVKGLTNAAGLWCSAIIGLACGSGFYEGAILSTAMILLVELVFSRIEYALIKRGKELTLYVEYSGRSSLAGIMSFFHSNNIPVSDLSVMRAPQFEGDTQGACALFTLSLNPKKMPFPEEKMLEILRGMKDVTDVQEI